MKLDGETFQPGSILELLLNGDVFGSVGPVGADRTFNRAVSVPALPPAFYFVTAVDHATGDNAMAGFSIF